MKTPKTLNNFSLITQNKMESYIANQSNIYMKKTYDPGLKDHAGSLIAHRSAMRFMLAETERLLGAKIVEVFLDLAVKDKELFRPKDGQEDEKDLLAR